MEYHGLVCFISLIHLQDIGYTELGQSWLFSILYIISTLAILFITEHKTLLHKYKSIVYVLFPVIMMFGLLPGVFATKLLER